MQSRGRAPVLAFALPMRPLLQRGMLLGTYTPYDGGRIVAARRGSLNGVYRALTPSMTQSGTVDVNRQAKDGDGDLDLPAEEVRKLLAEVDSPVLVAEQVCKITVGRSSRCADACWDSLWSMGQASRFWACR